MSNVVILAVILAFVLQTSHTTTSVTAKPVALANAADTTAVNPVDQLSSANIALTVARLSSLPETTAITNQADSQATQLTMAPTNDNVVAKPQVVATALKSRADIQTYTAQAGDSISSIATKFGITSDTVRWSNSLVSNNVPAGTKLVISPINGLVYTVKAGDTADSLAAKFKANKDQIIAFNDAELTGIAVGEQIIIPNGTQATAVTSSSSRYTVSGFAWGTGALFGGNGYDYGYCTWWAAQQRLNHGQPMPTNLGDAWSWKYRAPAAGLSVSGTPVAGAIIWFNMAYPGHVGYVESVNADGSITISEMNMRGWGVVDRQTISPDQFGNYAFIN